MNKTMKPRAWTAGLVAAGWLMGAAPQVRAADPVSAEDFNALKKTVEQLNLTVQKLVQMHDADQQTHQKDQEQIQQLQQKLGETHQIAEAAEDKAESAARAQTSYRIPTDSGSVNRNFMMLGDAEVQYAKTQGQHGGFVMADFAPIFLYRASDNVLFEAGFDFGLQNTAPTTGGNTTTLNMSFAQLDYLINDYVTLVAGSMLLPLGTYSERAAGWLNKLPDDPLARDLLPGAGAGAQLRGAFAIGESGQRLSYSVWGVNGPSSADGTGSAAALDLGGNVGLRSDNTVANLHGNPSGGARLGYFAPFKPHYDLEIGISGQSGEWDDSGQHIWTAGVIDASLHLGSFVEVKGEYIRTQYGSDDLGNVRPRGWWAQAGYKLAGLNFDWPVINNVEVVGRYDDSRDGLGTNTRRWSPGFIYYITNALLFEGDYEFIHSSDPTMPGTRMILQLGYGF